VNKKSIIFTLLLLTALSFISLFAVFTAKKITRTAKISDNKPDFFLTKATYTQFDSSGEIGKQFYTDKITHFANNNKYVFDKPHIKMQNENEQPWYITADKGKSEGGKSKIFLWDNVKVIQAAGQNNPDFDITSDTLTIYPDTKIAETDGPITIIQNESIVRAIGAQANFKDGTLKLLSNVECQYEIK